MNTVLPSLDPAKKSVKVLREFYEETDQMDAMETRARHDIDSAADEGRLDDAKIRRKIGDAQQSLDIVKARRDAVDRGIRTEQPRLRELVRRLDNEWQAYIEGLAAADHERHIAALIPIYGSEEKARSAAALADSPLKAEFQRAIIHLPCIPHLTGLPLIDAAVQLVRRVQKFLKKPEFSAAENQPQRKT